MLGEKPSPTRHEPSSWRSRNSPGSWAPGLLRSFASTSRPRVASSGGIRSSGVLPSNHSGGRPTTPHRRVLVEDGAPLVHDRDRLAGMLDQRPKESARSLGDLEGCPLLRHVDQHAVHQELAALGIRQEQRPFVDPAHPTIRQHDAVLVALRLLAAALEEPAVRGADAVAVVRVPPFHPPVVAARPFLLGEADDRFDVRAHPERCAVGAIDIERRRDPLQELRPWRSGPRRLIRSERVSPRAVAISAHASPFLAPIVPRIGRRAKAPPSGAGGLTSRRREPCTIVAAGTYECQAAGGICWRPSDGLTSAQRGESGVACTYRAHWPRDGRSLLG